MKTVVCLKEMGFSSLSFFGISTLIRVTQMDPERKRAREKQEEEKRH